jgi:ParB/RepB/Spo0J family partition protein
MSTALAEPLTEPVLAESALSAIPPLNGTLNGDASQNISREIFDTSFDPARDGEIRVVSSTDWAVYVENAVACGLARIPLSGITPNPFQPRKRALTEEEIEELAASISMHNLIENILVRPMAGENQWQLIAGHRRLAALRLLHSRGQWPDSVLAGVRRASDTESLELALEENVRRHDINPLDEALAYAALEKLGRTQEQIAVRFSLSQGAVSNRIRLLNLPMVVREMLAAQELTASHGIVLLSLGENVAVVQEFAYRAWKSHWSVAELEAEVKAFAEAEGQRLNPQLPIGDDEIGDDEIGDDESEEAVDVDESGETTAGEATAPDASTSDKVILVSQDKLDDIALLNSAATLVENKGKIFGFESATYICTGSASQHLKYYEAIAHRVVEAASYQGRKYSHDELNDLEGRNYGRSYVGVAFKAGKTEYVITGPRVIFKVPQGQVSAGSSPEVTPESSAEKSTTSTPASTPAQPKTKKELFAVGDKVCWNADSGDAKNPKWLTGEIAEVGGALFFVQPTGTSDAAKRKSFQKKHCILQEWDGKSVPGASTSSEPVKNAKQIADEKAKSTPANSSKAGTPSSTPAATTPPTRKAPEGMTATFAPTDDLFFAEDHGLTVKDVYSAMRRLIVLSQARSITPDEYLAALEAE